MKSFHIVFILLLLPVLFIVSCKKDMSKPLPELIIGKWKLDTMFISGKIEGRDTLIGLTKQYDREIEYKSDRTYIDTVINHFARYGTWALSDSMLTPDEQPVDAVKIIQLDDVQLKTEQQSSEVLKSHYWYSRISN